MKLLFFYLFISIQLFGQNTQKLDSLLANKKGKIKVGLVLSGGGAKGYIHIGALKVIEKSGLKIDYIGGTSVGALIGSLYATGHSAYELNKIIKDTSFNYLFLNGEKKFSPFHKKNEEKYLFKLPFKIKTGIHIPQSINRGQATLQIISNLLNRADEIEDFSKLPIPFFCMATNLENGKQKIIENGYLPQAVLASSAFPLLLPPVEIDNTLYIDGGVVNNFPILEMKKKNVDIIIGINLGQPLYKKDEMPSVTTIINQISSYETVKNTKDQIKHADILLNPDLTSFNTLNFNNSIILLKKGEEEAEKHINLFNKIVNHNKQYNNEVSPVNLKKLKNKDVVFLESINVNGLNKISKSYLLDKLSVYTPQIVKYSYIEDRINFLYATDQFSKIYFKTKTQANGRTELILDVEESKSFSNIKMGLHYDPVFKSSLLVNYTNNRLGFNNSLFLIDFVLGDSPRYNISYFIDNGIKPSVGFNSSYKSANLNKIINGNGVNFLSSEFENRFYFQSSIQNIVTFSSGLEYKYISINNKTGISNINSSLFTQNSYFISSYFSLKADTKNNSEFASRGVFLDTTFQYLMLSNTSNFLPIPFLSTAIEFYIPFPKSNKLYLNIKTTLGGFFQQNAMPPPIGFEFNAGSMFKQNFLNAEAYSGLLLGNYSGAFKLHMQSGIQYKLFPNQYIGVSAMAINFSQSLKDLQLIPKNNFAIEASYGIQTFLGPVKGYFTYSFAHKTVFSGINIGYWF